MRYWVQAVRPGYILFEVDGCTEVENGGWRRGGGLSGVGSVNSH